MDKEQIIKNEKENDGQTVYLYYDPMAGVYAAYGLSAYYATMVVNCFTSFSIGVDMPVALMRKVHVNMLRQSLIKISHETKSFYKFQTVELIGNAGYDKWKKKIIEKYNNI